MRTLIVIAAVLLATPAQAQQFWRKSDLLVDMFPDADKVAPVVLSLDANAKHTFEARLGYAPPLDAYTFYAGSTGETVDGYVLFDDQIGKHEPITFAVQLTPEGVVVRQELVTYREKYGGEVGHVRFRKQFEGKTGADPLEAGKDVMIISGATMSSHSMAIGVKRAIVLTELLVEKQAKEALVRATP